MEISLEGSGHKAALLAATFAISLVVIFEAGKLWLADRWIHSKNAAEMERGASLLPGDGEAWDVLGQFYQWDLLHSDLARAMKDYQRAVGDDPLSADYWMDVASASEVGGDEAAARRAFERAEALYPSSAQVAFYYGNFLLRQQDYPAAYRRLRQAVAADPALLPLAISRAWRSTEDVNQLLNEVLPPNVDAYAQALDFLVAIHQTDAALTVWERMRQLGKTIPLARTFPLFDELIRADRADDARRVWREALAAAAFPSEEPAGGSLVSNGDFKSDFREGGLGWRWDSPPGAAIDFDAQPGPNGSRVIRIDFTGGENLSLDAPYQYVPVEPSERYRFHASVRTDGITTESGIEFLLTDPNHRGAVNVTSDDFTGSHPWTAIDLDVTTGPETHFLLVQVVRVPSRLFDNKLSGTAWIADVSLTASGVPERASGELHSP